MKINLSKSTIEMIKINKNKCIDCKKCYTPCPMMKEFSTSPKKIMENIIDEGCVDKRIPYSCMLCGACDNKCPKEIDVKSIYYGLRKDLFTNNKKSLKDLGYTTIKFHQVNSFSPLFSSRRIDVKSKSVFLPGCSLASYNSDIIESTFEYLKAKIDNVSLVMNCCGKPTQAMGDVEKFNDYYSKFDKMLKENNIKEVIVACPNCYNTIKNNSESIKVTSIWEIISKHGIDKNLYHHYKNLNTTFALHDPCPMRSENEIHEYVRNILSELGVDIIEFENNKERSECCGAGGMVRVTNSNISKNQANKRAGEVNADVIISYCQSCCESMMLENKQTLHLLDFIFNRDVINKKVISQKTASTINKWSMRYKSNKLTKKQ